MINKSGHKQVDEMAQMFEAKVYDNRQLQDFHNKIQRFWEKPREVELGALSGTAQKFNHQELGVAFGACRKVVHGKTYVYQYEPERHRVLENLWGQYSHWREWGEGRHIKTLTDEKVPF